MFGIKDKKTIEEIMNPNVIDIDINAKVEDAVKIMSEKNIEKLVVKDKGEVSGILELTNINKPDLAKSIRDITLSRFYRIAGNIDAKTIARFPHNYPAILVMDGAINKGIITPTDWARSFGIK